MLNMKLCLISMNWKTINYLAVTITSENNQLKCHRLYIEELHFPIMLLITIQFTGGIKNLLQTRTVLKYQLVKNITHFLISNVQKINNKNMTFSHNKHTYNYVKLD